MSKDPEKARPPRPGDEPPAKPADKEASLLRKDSPDDFNPEREATPTARKQPYRTPAEH